MFLIFFIFSMFLPIFVLHLLVDSSIDSPLDWFHSFPSFYHCLLCIRRFLAKFHIYMQFFGQNPHIHACFWPKVVYMCYFYLYNRIHPPFWLGLMLWEVVGWVVSVVGSSLVLMLSVGCFFCDQRLSFH